MQSINMAGMATAAAGTICNGQTRRFAARRSVCNLRLRTVMNSASSNPSVLSSGPQTPRPDYTEIDNQPMNKLITDLFRKKVVAVVGKDNNVQGYEGIIDLIREVNNKAAEPREVQTKTRAVLNSMFPGWLMPAFKVMFANAFPELSNWLCAWVTMFTCQWLMGPSKVNDVEINGKVMKQHGVKIERCRYLESAGCVSICINSCKLATQEFFKKDMALDVTLQPNYEDFSCQFVFGLAPLPTDADDAFKSPCFTQCPTKRRLAALAAAEAAQPNCHRIPELESISQQG